MGLLSQLLIASGVTKPYIWSLRPSRLGPELEIQKRSKDLGPRSALFRRWSQAETEHGGGEQHADEDVKGQVVTFRVVEEQAEERRAAGGEQAGDQRAHAADFFPARCGRKNRRSD